MNTRRIAILTWTVVLGTAACAQAAMPTMVNAVSGRVFRDANANGTFDPGETPLPGVRVSDGVGFAASGSDGSYTLTFAKDASVPYRPARVVAVSWPSGTWPSGPWWRRLGDVEAGRSTSACARTSRTCRSFFCTSRTTTAAAGCTRYGPLT